MKDFTPAPWEYPNGHGILASGQPLKVAGRTKRAVANRRMIAKAPDMYVALKTARDRILCLDGNTGEIDALLKQIESDQE